MTALHRAVVALEAAGYAVMGPDFLRELVDALTVECPRCDERRPELIPCADDSAEHCEPCAESCDACAAAFWADLDADCARDEER